jgi:DNA polymerase-3 subunit alpha
LDGKEIVVAGVVTSAEQRTTKDGKQVFGIFTVEDYGGRYEFRLYRKDYERFRPLLYEGYYLLIRGNVVTTTFYKKEDVARENPTVRIEYRISTITQLQEVADGIKEINISVPIEKLDNQFVSELAEAVKNSRGKASLRMTLIDSTDGVTLRLHSKKRKVSLSEQLVQFMEKYNLDFGMGQTS